MKRQIKKLVVVLLVASMCIGLFPMMTFAEDDFIKVQPANVSVTSIEEAIFHVEAKDPAKLDSYQWIFIDKEFQIFVLEGITAHTDTLVIPCGEDNIGDCHVACMITDTDGNVHYSDYAEYNVTESNEKTLLYVESYVLLPGQSIDLANPAKGKSYESIAPSLGTGTISLSNDGMEVTFDNVDMNNDEVLYDWAISPAISIMYRTTKNTNPTLKLNLIGENKVHNKFYQELTNGSGIPIDFYCLGKNEIYPELIIGGEGSLNITGGTYLIRHNGPVTIDAPLTLNQYEGHFCDGIHAGSASTGKLAAGGWDTTVRISKNGKIDADINGTFAFSDTGIYVEEGTQIDIKSSAPDVGAGDTTKNIFYSPVVDIRGSKVSIDMYCDPDRFSPPEMVVGGFTGISVAKDGKCNIVDSELDIKLRSGIYPNYEFAYNGVAISTGTDADTVINNSKVNIDIDAAGIAGTKGIYVGGELDITDSDVNVSVKGAGLVNGIYVRDGINITDSRVDSYVDSYESSSKEFDIASRGITSEGPINISLANYGDYVKSVSKKGLSFGVDYSKGNKEPIGYDPEYKAQYITIADNASIVTPEKSGISTTSRLNGKTYYYSEAVYDLNDTSKEAEEVFIKSNTPEPPAPAPDPEPTPQPQSGPSVDTGDSANLTLYIVIAAISMILLVGIVVWRCVRRKR